MLLMMQSVVGWSKAMENESRLLVVARDSAALDCKLGVALVIVAIGFGDFEGEDEVLHS